MIRIDETQERCRKLIREAGVADDEFVDFENDDGEGVVLDSGDMCGVVPEWCNYEIKQLYPNLTANTNLGVIDLVKEVQDEDDWFTIEDCLKDLVTNDGYDENQGERFQH